MQNTKIKTNKTWWWPIQLQIFLDFHGLLNYIRTFWYKNYEPQLLDSNFTTHLCLDHILDVFSGGLIWTRLAMTGSWSDDQSSTPSEPQLKPAAHCIPLLMKLNWTPLFPTQSFLLQLFIQGQWLLLLALFSPSSWSIVQEVNDDHSGGFHIFPSLNMIWFRGSSNPYLIRWNEVCLKWNSTGTGMKWLISKRYWFQKWWQWSFLFIAAGFLINISKCPHQQDGDGNSVVTHILLTWTRSSLQISHNIVLNTQSNDRYFWRAIMFLLVFVCSVGKT